MNTVSELSDSVAELPISVGQVPDSNANPSPALVIRNHVAILAMTAEVFPGGKIEVEEGVDPEIEDETYLVVNVTTSDDVRQAVARNIEWHRRLREVACQTARSYRLSLDLR